ncbi:MAG: zinc-binding alcohol dehydrogenase, partial [Candidatus Brockarchaeota archaeon]|nr:zinc-binding alcohol dehydrogenase [Candidatus Brockarchaeota archaeon]
MAGRRVVFAQKGVVEVQDFHLKEPGPKEVLVRSVSSLISSGTEGAFLMALPNTPQTFPQYPGYSNAGVVEAVGSDVKGLSRGVGVVSWANHASHALCPAERVFAIPDGLSFDEASFFALASTALQGVRRAEVELGESVAGIGQGVVGQLALQLAKLSGATPLVAIDVIDERLEISKSCGADLAVNPKKANVEGEVRAATEGKGADVVIEATGNPEAIPVAFKLASANGRVVLLGSPRGECTVNFYPEIHRKAIKVIGAHNSMRPERDSHHGHWTEGDDIRLVLKLMVL